jgi:uncharacterized protein YqgC (DUF456 family)
VTTEELVGLIVTVLVMSVGLLGSILPGLPSTPVVLIAAIGHRLYFGQQGASIWVLVILGLLTAISAVMDYLASMVGAKKLGATRRGVIGAIVGGFIGLFFSLPGILLGPFIGALVFELAGRREFKQAAQAGLGATLGLLAGAVGKAICCVMMMGLFTLNVILRAT